MKWVRCPKCGTVNDVDRYPICDGCNRDLAGVPGFQEPRAPEPRREAARDTKFSDGMIVVLGILSLFGLIGIYFSKSVESGLGLGIVTALVLAPALWLLFTRVVRRRTSDSCTTGIVYLVGSIGAVAGAAILVLIACSKPLSSL